MQSPYAELIRVYFPSDQWENADCITLHEDGSQEPARVSPANWDGSRDHGLFQINDGVWNPDNNPRSPFTRAQWSQVYDPNVNVWMASVIFSGNGWGDWATRFLCGVDGIRGPHSIPHPDGPYYSGTGGSGGPVFIPVSTGGPVATPYPTSAGGGLFVVLGAVALAAGAMLLTQRR